MKLLKSWKSWKYWNELSQRLVNLTWYYHLLLLGMVLLFPRQRRINFLFFFRKVGIFYLLLNFLIKRETLQWIRSVHDWRLRGFPETSHQWRKQHRNFPWMFFAIQVLTLLISRKVENYLFSLQNILISKKMVANEIENHNMQWRNCV